jgi:hypothetical protein
MARDAVIYSRRAGQRESRTKGWRRAQWGGILVARRTCGKGSGCVIDGRDHPSHGRTRGASNGDVSQVRPLDRDRPACPQRGTSQAPEKSQRSTRPVRQTAPNKWTCPLFLPLAPFSPPRLTSEVSMRAWQGDWRERVYQAVSTLGEDSLHSLLRTHPLATIGEIFGIIRTSSVNLGMPPICYGQIPALIFEEADARFCLADLMCDLSYRALARHLPDGWNQGRSLQKRQLAFLRDIPIPPSHTRVPPDEDRSMLAIIRERGLPNNWVPRKNNDPTLRDVVSAYLLQGSDFTHRF